MLNNATRPVGQGPRSRMCYVCGRQTLLAGYDHHVSKCKEIFIKREMLKPKRERRPIPEDPMLTFHAADQMGDMIRHGALDAYNDHAERAFQATLAACQFCGRTFQPDKLLIHNRSCTASNPAKGVSRPPSSGAALSSTIANPVGAAGGHLPNIADRPDSNCGARTTSSLFGNPKKQKSMNSVRFKEAHEESLTPARPIKPNPHNYSTFEDFEKDIVPASLITCPDCGRHFNEQAFSHHSNVCKKVFGQARKPFDSRKHRIQGTDMEAVAPKKPPPSKMQRPASMRSMQADSTGGVSSMPKSKGSNWKNKSSAFRDAIREARQISIAERHAKEKGIPLAAALPPAIIRSPDDPLYDDYVQCPHCGRKYNQTAGARHIPQCKNIFAKPSRLIKGTGHAAVPVRPTMRR